MQVLRRADFPAVPWKNGLGVSRVVATQPAGAGYDALLCQVATTRIAADCPFSSLRGLDRRFMLLEGEGVELDCRDAAVGVDRRIKIDTPFAPVAFSGDWQTTCRLVGGPVAVMNVMTRRGRVGAVVDVRRWSGAMLCAQRAGETLIAVMLEGKATIAGEVAPLVPNDAVLLDARSGGACRIEAQRAGARIAIVRLAAR